MAILTSGTTFVANTQISATDLNNAVDASAFTSGAVDSSTTQLSSGAIIVKDGGITAAKITSTSSSWTFVGSITSSFTGNISGSVATHDLITLTPVTGYPVSGSIPIGLTTGSNQYLAITGTSTLSLTGIYNGAVVALTIKNTSRPLTNRAEASRQASQRGSLWFLPCVLLAQSLETFTQCPPCDA